MTQIQSSSIKISLDQAEVVVNNLATVRHFTKVEKLFKGLPSFSEESMKKLESLGINAGKITKFADNYVIYRLSEPKENASSRALRQYNKSIKIKNLNDRVEFVIVVDSDKFDKQHYLAIIALYPIIHDELAKQLNLKNKKFVAPRPEDIAETREADAAETPEKETQDKKADSSDELKGGSTLNRNFELRSDSDECLVTIAPTNKLPASIIKHFDANILPCTYRIVSAQAMYYLLGSTTRVMGSYCWDYELCEYEQLYNKREYGIIQDSDIVTKILNGRQGDLIVCKAIRTEGTPYAEFEIRQVCSMLNEGEESVDTSGVYVI